MARASGKLAVSASGFVVLRTPLLPFEELEAWSAIGATDRPKLRRGLCELLARPEIAEALWVAAPDLEIGIAAWRHDPESIKGRRAERALVRYLFRMASRPTPFGLFAGCTVGALGSTSHLRLAGRDTYRRHTRLDMSYLVALSEDLVRDPEVRRGIDFHPNSSLYRVAGRLRYIEARLQGRERSHHLVEVAASDALRQTLERATPGASVAKLVQGLMADPEISADTAEAFIDELIDSQILMPSLVPPVTGKEPIDDFVDQLAGLCSEDTARRHLVETRHRCRQLDAAGLGRDPESYRTIARQLEMLPTRIELPRLFQVDMLKPAARVCFGSRLIKEVERGVEILQSLAEPPAPDSALDRFREEFRQRYGEGRTVPLVEALDEEIGVGFAGARGSDVSPLLAGLEPLSTPDASPDTWGARSSWLLAKLTEALLRDHPEIEITHEELAPLRDAERLPFPDAFQVMAKVAASSEEAIGRGDFRVLLKHAVGPSGARFLGRFCQADETLRQRVEEHLRAEEARDDEAIFAEIVHLPAGGAGNVVPRPVLRDWEIPFLGRGGAPKTRQIPIEDLLVTVSGHWITLHSRRLGRRVIPRLSSAHNLGQGNLAIYRFLGLLQSQGVRATLTWSWGALRSAPFLPRVRCGRVVLERAQWRVAGSELTPFAGLGDTKLFRAIQAWRRERRLPRWVLLIDHDRELLVDLLNILAIESFLALVKDLANVVLAELFPSPDELCVRGPEGRFIHEVLIPFVRRKKPQKRRESRRVRSIDSSCQRNLSPGSEWLYAKLFTGTATADRMLTEWVRPWVAEAVESGAVDHWFFIRFNDPRWHLRVRLHGDPQRLLSEVLPSLHRWVTPRLEEGWLQECQIGTYERELERYGGASGIELAERLFHIDSEAVLRILEGLAGDAGEEARWKLALRGSDLLLTDLGFDGRRKVEILQTMRSHAARELGLEASLKRRLARRWRRDRKQLERLLEPGWEVDDPLAFGFTSLAWRSRTLAPIVAQLHRLKAVSLTDLAASYVHMFNNRLLRSAGQQHELVLYDFLERLNRSRLHRD